MSQAKRMQAVTLGDGHGDRGDPYAEASGIVPTPAELLEMSRDAKLEFQVDPRKGETWTPESGPAFPRRVTGVQTTFDGMAAPPRVFYRLIGPTGRRGDVQSCYLACFRTWALRHKATPRDKDGNRIKRVLTSD